MLDFGALASSSIREALRVAIAAPNRECYPGIWTPDVSDQVFRAPTAANYNGQGLFGLRERTTIPLLWLCQGTGLRWPCEGVGLLRQGDRVVGYLSPVTAGGLLTLSIHLQRSLPVRDFRRFADQA